ncbi:hypothetical protein DIR46_17605 [Massilia oculi]|uniref:Uncharacterized protein n=1 Tax=Massilia oculi TaxID=945844 RepID=A0A2S2DL78_9BURK|nr:hypothetical protein DIR46_17605 [Massilia oculi]
MFKTEKHADIAILMCQRPFLRNAVHFQLDGDIPLSFHGVCQASMIDGERCQFEQDASGPCVFQRGQRLIGFNI